MGLRGGTADGEPRIPDLKPKELHQRSPLFIGSPAMVEEVMKG